MGGFIPVPGQSIYGATKAAVKLLTEALHAECKGTPVRVTVVIPGGMATNMPVTSGVSAAIDPAKAAELSKNLPTAESAAAQILDGMERNAYRVIIGRDARLMDRPPEGPGWEQVFLRENPAGRHRELWRHEAGCGAWLVVERDVTTHEVFGAELAETIRAG